MRLWLLVFVLGRYKIIHVDTPCNKTVAPLMPLITFNFCLVLNISRICHLLDCYSYRGLLYEGKKECNACIKKPPRSTCRFKVKVNFTKAPTAHIVFSVTFWKSHSWCVLWTGLVAADSGSGWIRNLSGGISDMEPEMSTRQHWYWEELPFSEITQWESRKEITFLLIPNQWGFCFVFFFN